MFATYIKAQYNQIFGRSKGDSSEVHNMDYRDGFKHGFDAGRSSCIGDLSVTALIKELIDRGDLEFAAKLLDELRDRAD